MFKNYDQAKDYIDTHDVKLVDFKILDLRGRWHHLSITAEKFNKKTIENGIGFDGSSYGFLTVEKSDMVFKPDLSTGFIDPFAENKTLVFLANIFSLDEGKRLRFKGDPRFIAKKAENYMKECDIATKSSFGPEFEFYLFDKMTYKTDPNNFGVFMDNSNARWNSMNKEENNNGFIINHHGGYHADLPLDKDRDIRDEMVLALEDNDIPVKYHHSEVGGPGQMEVEVSFADTLTIGDRSMKLKYILKNIATKHNKTLTFMPKPFNEEAGNGMHIHFHLFKEGKPVFYDSDGYSGLSKEGLFAIGGILKHAKALLAITNPSTNSYKRLVPGYEAPVSICFATANRSAVIRIPGYATDPEKKRFEFRSSDATANPYLAYSAILMAAIDGIENEIDPTKEGFGPIDTNIFDLPKEEKEKIESLPKSLEEASIELKNDHEFLLKGDVFTKGLINDLIEQNLKDHKEISIIPTSKEFEKYYDL